MSRWNALEHVREAQLRAQQAGDRNLRQVRDRDSAKSGEDAIPRAPRVVEPAAAFQEPLVRFWVRLLSVAAYSVACSSPIC